MLPVTISGTGFTEDSVVHIEKANGEDPQALTSYFNKKGDTLVVDVSNVAVGEYIIIVEDGSGANKQSAHHSFKVNTHAPVIETIRSDTHVAKRDVQVTIGGSYLGNVTVVQFDADNNNIDNIEVTLDTNKGHKIEPTMLQFKVTLPSTKVELTYDVKVTNNYGQFDTVEDGFTVIPELTIDNINPDEVVAGN